MQKNLKVHPENTIGAEETSSQRPGSTRQDLGSYRLTDLQDRPESTIIRKDKKSLGQKGAEQLKSSNHRLDQSIIEQLEHYSALIKLHDHYQLLGVAVDAPKALIKESYFKLAKTFHTDRYTTEQLGEKREQMQVVFSALTKAHDVISKKKTRAAYDDYRHSRQSTRQLRTHHSEPAPESVDPTTQPSKESEAAIVYAEQNIPKAPRTPLIEQVIQPNQDPRSESWTGSRPQNTTPQPQLKEPDGDHLNSLSPSSRPSQHSQAPSSPRDRAALRKNLARKLKGHQRTTVNPSSNPQKVSEVQVRKAAVDGFRERYRQESRSSERVIKRLEQEADEAERTNDIASLVARLKSLEPFRTDDAQFQKRLKDAEHHAEQAYSTQFLAQARYEEKQGEFSRAAISYQRAARGQENAAHFHKAAECFLRAGKLSREAVSAGKEAIRLNNSEPLYHLTLAQAYNEAAMSSSARAAAERALELDPNNQLATSLLKELR